MKSLIKYHFTVIFIHLLIASCIFLTKYDNISRANVPASKFNSAVNYVNGYLIVSVVMLGIQLFLTIIGLPYLKIFFTPQLTLQIIGVFSYGCFILIKMNYLTIAYMWGVFCLIPFLLDILSIIMAVLKNKKFEHVKL